MLMTIVLLAAAASPALARVDTAKCATPGADKAATRPASPPRARPLSEMPPARAVLTVYRQVDGCPVLLVKDGGRIVEEPAGRPELRRVFRP